MVSRCSGVQYPESPSVVTQAETLIPASTAERNRRPEPRMTSSSCGETKSQHSRSPFQFGKTLAGSVEESRIPFERCSKVLIRKRFWFYGGSIVPLSSKRNGIRDGTHCFPKKIG